MGKYFGTDGFRGEANMNLTADHAYTVGRFLGWYYSELKKRAGSTEPVKIIISKDTRCYSYMFVNAMERLQVSRLLSEKIQPWSN